MEPTATSRGTAAAGATTSRRAFQGTEREDVAQTRAAIRLFRRLCNDYHEGFSLPSTSIFAREGSRDQLPADATALRQRRSVRRSRSSSSSSSSSSGFSAQQEEESESAVEWSRVKKLLDATQAQQLSRELKDVNRSFKESANKAVEFNLELDILEEKPPEDVTAILAAVPDDAAMQQLMVGGPDTEPLKAAKRVAKTMPKLRQYLAHAKEQTALRKAAEEEAEREREKERESAHVAAPSPPRSPRKGSQSPRSPGGHSPGHEEDSDHEEDNDAGEKEGVVAEVNKRMPRLNVMDDDGDPVIAKIIEAQRREIRALAQELEGVQNEIEVVGTAMEYVEGTLRPVSGVVRTHIDDAIKVAQDLQGKIFDEFRYDMKKRFEEECRRLNIPDEDDVQVCRQEILALKEKQENVQQRIDHLRSSARYRVAPSAEEDLEESVAGSAFDAEDALDEAESVMEGNDNEEDEDNDGDDVAAEDAEEGAAGVSTSAPAAAPLPTLCVAAGKAEQLLFDLKDALQELEGTHAQKEKEVAKQHNLLNTAERTVKSLEEAKILFLETIAVEDPHIFAEDPSFKRNEKLLRGNAANAATERESEETEKNSEALAELKRETNRLLLELAGYDAKFKAVDLTPLVGREPNLVEAYQEAADELKCQVEKSLTGTVETPREGGPLGGGGGAGGGGGSPRASSPRNAAGFDLAALRSPSRSSNFSRTASESGLLNPISQVVKWLKLRDENEQMLERIRDAQKAVDAMCALKGGLADASGAGASEQLLNDVQRKRRELCALRKRWWYDRQERQITMRRKIAGHNLASGENADPLLKHDGLYARLHSSMTLA